MEVIVKPKGPIVIEGPVTLRDPEGNEIAKTVEPADTWAPTRVLDGWAHQRHAIPVSKLVVGASGELACLLCRESVPQRQPLSSVRPRLCPGQKTVTSARSADPPGAPL